MRMRAVPLGVLSALLGGALLAGVATAGPNHGKGHKEKAHKADICHQRGNGSYKLINVSKKALPAHERHGDAYPGDAVEGGVLGEDCSLSETQRVESPPLNFGPTGWGGWSCPAGTTAVGGGYEPDTATVQESQLAAPGSSWPHYTFGPAESGWVVQNDNDSETITVYVICTT